MLESILEFLVKIIMYIANFIFGILLTPIFALLENIFPNLDNYLSSLNSFLTQAFDMLTFVKTFFINLTGFPNELIMLPITFMLAKVSLKSVVFLYKKLVTLWKFIKKGDSE